MALFYFFISLVIVKVSTYNIMDYTKDVALTNAHIQLAYDMNHITLKDKFVLNGLEHVIKTIIGNNDYSLGMMNNMIAVPEYRLRDDWNVCKEAQIALREEIQKELNIAVPRVPEPNFRTFYLIDLGAERRNLTGKALKNILNRAINYGDPENVTNLIHERRLHGINAFESRIIRALAGPEEELSVLWMCRLIALFKSTKFPKSYVEDIQTYLNDSCTLNYGSTNKTYRKIEGQWCEVQPLKEQLI